VEISIKVPKGWVEEENPGPMKVESADLVAGSEWKAEGGALAYRRTARLLAAEIPLERYEQFRESLQRVQTEDARAVVFVKH